VGRKLRDTILALDGARAAPLPSVAAAVASFSVH